MEINSITFSECAASLACFTASEAYRYSIENGVTDINALASIVNTLVLTATALYCLKNAPKGEKRDPIRAFSALALGTLAGMKRWPVLAYMAAITATSGQKGLNAPAFGIATVGAGYLFSRLK